MSQQTLGSPMYSMTLCIRKMGTFAGLTPLLASAGMTVDWMYPSSQLISIPPITRFPQESTPVAESACGTVMVIGASFLTVRLTANPGLIPVGFAYFQNSARWKASVTWPVPIGVPPQVQGWLTNRGDCRVRVVALAPGSQLSILFGLKVA